MEEELLGEPGDMSWTAFEERYASEHLSGLALKTREAWASASAQFKRACNPEYLSDATSSALSRFKGYLRTAERVRKKPKDNPRRKRKPKAPAKPPKVGVRETSITTYLRTLLAGLSWAHKMGMLPQGMPTVVMPKRAKGFSTLMRSRPITREEHERMQMATRQVRTKDAQLWLDFLEGLWLSGLRLGEALTITWHWNGAFSVDLSKQYPLYRIFAEGEKGHKDRLLPVAPEFAAWLLAIPAERRKGKVFKVPLTSKRVSKVISDIGKRAGVRTGRDDETATAQDYRRAFGTRWAPRVSPVELKELMRHRSIDTTMEYYVSIDANELAAKLWEKARNETGGKSGGKAPQSRTKT